MHRPSHPRRNGGTRAHVIAACATVAGLLALAAGCGVSASLIPASQEATSHGTAPLVRSSHGVAGTHPVAAAEALPAAGEGIVGGRAAPGHGGKPAGKSGGTGGTGGTGAGTAPGAALFGGTDPLVGEQGALGRTLAIVRVYYHIGDAFPTPEDQAHMAAGSTLLVSLDSTGTSYASIAAGDKDGAILSFLRAVNQAAVRYHLSAIYVSFQHEPDNSLASGLGSPAEFVQAWDHVRQLAASAHLNWQNGGRLHWVLIIIHSTFASGAAISFWPGAGEVDVVAVDGYNSYRCKSSLQSQAQTPARLFDPALSFAASHGGLPVFIAEWGSDTVQPAEQTTFIQQMQSYVAGNPQIAAALYWDEGGPNCNYAIDNNSAALSALAAMGHSSAMQGSV